MATVAGILLALLCMEHCMGGANGDYMTNTARLLDDLFKDYNSWVIPVHQGPLKVVHGVRVQRVLDFDPYKQIATVDVWLTMEWTDTRLQWDPSQYVGNVTKVMVPNKALWLPDMFLYSGGSSPPGDDQSTVVCNAGGVQYVSRTTTLTAYCSDTNITDEFECQLKFMPWVYDSTMLDLQLLNEHGGSADLSCATFSDYLKWKVVSFTVDRHVVRYACCPEPFVVLVYKLRIRQPGFVADSVNMRVEPGFVADSVNMRLKSGEQYSVVQNANAVMSVRLGTSVSLGTLVWWLLSLW